MTKVLRLLTIAALVAMMPATAGAVLIWDTLSPITSAPPTTVGGIPVTPFPDDLRPEYSTVSDAPSPWGSDVLFSTPTTLLTVGSGWATWSNGYTGDVYYTGLGTTTLTLTLPGGTRAFYFYAEPAPFASYKFTAVGDGVSAVNQTVAGLSGAAFFGIYGTAGESINSIVITTSTPGPIDFAIGEFGISAPEPGTLLLLGSGLSALALRRRRKV